MPTFKRETTRQGLIRDASCDLAHRFPMQTESNYRQNVWTVIDSACERYPHRRLYLEHITPLARRRLYYAIARAAYHQTRLDHPTFPLKMSPVPLIIRLP